MFIVNNFFKNRKKLNFGVFNNKKVLELGFVCCKVKDGRWEVYKYSNNYNGSISIYVFISFILFIDNFEREGNEIWRIKVWSLFSRWVLDLKFKFRFFSFNVFIFFIELYCFYSKCD